jgi:flagellin-like protein
MNKKGISEVVTTVLLILIAIAGVAIIWIGVSIFIGGGKIENAAFPFISKSKFEIQPITADDILFDRFRLKNTGQETLSSYVIKIDSVQEPLTVQKIIEPQENEYLYLANNYPAGEHSLYVESNNYKQTVKITVGEDWHIVISNTTVE